MVPQRPRQLERALDRRYGVTEEHQRHPVPGRQADQFTSRLGPAELGGAAEQFLQPVQKLPLLRHRQARVSDQVHEQDVGNLKLERSVRFGWHDG